MQRKLWIITSGVAFAAGATIATMGRPRALGFGLTLTVVATLAAATWVICCQLDTHTRDVEAAFEMGHSAGYREGRRVARPVVVPMLEESEREKGWVDAHSAAAFGQVAGDRPPARRDETDLYGTSQG